MSRNIAAGLAVAMLASAAPDVLDLSALKWRNIGPNRGGRSQACAGSSRRPFEYYFGATGGGLWKTVNGGTTWSPVTDGQIHSSSVGAIAVSESNPDVVYIGMGETELRSSVMQGDGVYKSTDAGKTWKHIGLADTQAISRIRIDPQNPDIVYVAALGHPFGPNADRGVFRSTDGGATWKRILFRNDHSGAIDLVMDPRNPRVLFASIWDVYRSPWMLSSGGPGSGLFKTTDGGDSWTEISRNPGMPKGVLGKINVAISGADSNRVYAMVEADDGGLFQSSDAGATWTLVNSDRAIRQRAFYFSRITADPNRRDTLYAMNVEFYRSDDGGKTFQLMHTAHPDHHDLWIAPNDSRRMIASDDGGASVSVDGGNTWTLEHYPTGQFYHVVTTIDIPYHVCGSQQDDGTACVPSHDDQNLHNPAGAPGDWFYAVAGGEAGYIAADPRNADIFYGGDQAGLITRYDRRTGETRSVTVYPYFFSGMPASALRDRWQWTFPIVFSPVDPHALYTSSQRLWKTTNQGQTWQPISGDLTRNDPKTLGDSGGPITKDQNGPEIYGTIYSIAPSRFDANTIWTGSDDGLVYLTRDGGKTWRNVTPPGMKEYTRISLIEASTSDAASAYIAARRNQLDDRAPYVYKTHDYGATWTSIVGGLPANDFAQAIREDTVRKGLLYLGTEHSIYYSLNDGANWESLALNLPDTQVADIAVEKHDLVIATHGRSFYVLDDIDALRQFSPEATSATAWLFKPEPAVRPLRPAVIDYKLASAGKATIEILDAQGKLVRKFDAPARKGTNRFEWDLRYPGSVTFPGIVLRYAVPGEGPYAPPGNYTVRLTAGGVTKSQPLVIERDPRLTSVTDADLQKQFELAIRVRDELSRAHEAVLRIRDLDTQLQAAVKSGRPAAVNAAQSFKSKLDEIESDLYQVKNRSPRDTLNYPIKLNNQLAVLQRIVDTGDYAPTDQDYAVFAELKDKLNQILGRLNQALSTDLPQLNTRLSAEHLPPVK